MEDFLTKPVLIRIYETFRTFSEDYKFLKHTVILSVVCGHFDLGIALKIQIHKVIFSVSLFFPTQQGSSTNVS